MKQPRSDAPSRELTALRREVASLQRQLAQRAATEQLKQPAAEASKLHEQNSQLTARLRSHADPPSRGMGRPKKSSPKLEERREEVPTGYGQDERVNFDNLIFVFAKTLASTPHWYCKRTAENEKDYVALFQAIQKFGRVEKWRGKPYRYLYRGDGFKCWAMTTAIGQSWIINQAKAARQ